MRPGRRHHPSLRRALCAGVLSLVLGGLAPWTVALPQSEWWRWEEAVSRRTHDLGYPLPGGDVLYLSNVKAGADWLTADHPLRVSPIPSRRLVGTPAEPGSDLGCLALLATEGVAFDEAPPTEGIATPVQVKGDRIGGIFYRYYYRGRKPRIFDCRLALALARAAPVLKRAGVTEVIFASHYRPSFGTLAKGKYHLHAQGLAIDIKGFTVGKGIRLSVPRDYEPGLGFMDPDSCLGRPRTPKGLLLRKIVCDLDEADVFEAILTPDYDDVHWNHFHFSAFHPAQQSLVRVRGTALLEVPLHDLMPWAMRRSVYQQPERRRWDEVAARPWPAGYRLIGARFGIDTESAPGEAVTGDELDGLADPWERLWSQVADTFDEISPEISEFWQLALASHVLTD